MIFTGNREEIQDYCPNRDLVLNRDWNTSSSGNNIILKPSLHSTGPMWTGGSYGCPGPGDTGRRGILKTFFQKERSYIPVETETYSVVFPPCSFPTLIQVLKTMETRRCGVMNLMESNLCIFHCIRGTCWLICPTWDIRLHIRTIHTASDIQLRVIIPQDATGSIPIS